MKKILLIAPPFYRLLGSHYNGLHLGLGYITAVLQQHGHQTDIYNADYLDNTEYLNQKQIFDNYYSYKALLENPADPLWDVEIRNKIAGYNPDVVGIAMVTANYKAARIIAGIVKSINKNTKVIVGGAHPTLDPRGTLAETGFDYVIRGEAEFAFLELVEGKKNETIKGLSYKKNGQLVHNEDRPFLKDLDSLPYPARDSFLNDTRYINVGYMMTGRGCPSRCTYCGSPAIWHSIVRLRSVDNVMGELELLKKKYHVSLLHLDDDTFTIKKDRAMEICRQMITKSLNMQWVCDTRADCLNKELIVMMKKAGCIRLKIGVESGSERILKAIRKGETKEKIRRAVKWIKEVGVPFTAYFMTGFPNETNEDLKETIDFARELDADYNSLSILAPYYGTQVWKELEKAGKKFDKEHWEYFYHQSQEMLLNGNLDPKLIDQFWALNDTLAGEKERV
ncbi:MAG: radical SAM protein [Dehalococcoidales bacterium]|nr:radical SAM protein [Dehalococcoidales bacterium]